MSVIASYHSYDHTSMVFVSVIASFDTQGHIVPLYVRLDKESYRISSCWASKCHSGIVEFHCKLIDGNYEKPLLLTYYPAEQVWGVPGCIFT